MKKTVLGSSLLAAVLLVLSGCTSVTTFDYTNAQGTLAVFQEKGIATKTITVLPFLDQRGAKYFSSTRPAGDHGSFYLGFIPLVPAGFVDKEEPENSVDFVTSGRFHFDVAHDLSNAAAVSLKASNLFKEVTKGNNIDQVKSDYIWRGIVTNTYYTGWMYSYCITYFFAPALWVFGAPFGTSENELWVQFELIDCKTGKAVWHYDYRGHDSITHWLYARIGKDTSMYPQLMKQAMNSALNNLSRTLPTLQ